MLSVLISALPVVFFRTPQMTEQGLYAHRNRQDLTRAFPSHVDARVMLNSTSRAYIRSCDAFRTLFADGPDRLRQSRHYVSTTWTVR
jgi:hypothetical protein